MVYWISFLEWLHRARGGNTSRMRRRNKMKIAIDPGHGGTARGGSFRGIDEADIVLLVALVMEKTLIDFGHEVVLTRWGDMSVALSTRAAIANKKQCDVFVSLHTNADPDLDEAGDPEARGEELWIYKGSANGRRLAGALMPYLDAVIPDTASRGVKESGGFVVLRETMMPAVLLELGFLDNREENVLLAHPGHIVRIAEKLSQGIQAYANSQE